MSAGVTRIARGSAEDLGPVVGEPLDVIRIARMRERMIQDGVVQAALVMRGCKPAEGVLSAGELEDGRTPQDFGAVHRFTLPLGTCAWLKMLTPRRSLARPVKSAA